MKLQDRITKRERKRWREREKNGTEKYLSLFRIFERIAFPIID